MMKRKEGSAWAKILSMTVMTAGAIWLMGVTAFAAPTVTVSADKSNIQVSDTVTVSVQASQPEDDSIAPQIEVTYDPALLEYSECDVECGGGGGQLSLSSLSANIQFKALSQGSAQISVSAVLTEDGASPATGSATVAVGGVGAGAGLSSDATLRAFTVSPGTLSPAFSPAVTEYTLAVDDATTDITVRGAVTDEKARITAAYGFKNLSDGKNDALITVTAEDESTLTYHFHIVRGAAPQVAESQPADASVDAQQEEQPAAQPENTEKFSIGAGAGAGTPKESSDHVTFSENGVTYQISQGFETSLLPQGCLKKDVTVRGASVQGAVFDSAGLTLVYAISGADGSGDFYIFDEKTDSFTLFVQIPTAGSGYIIPLRGGGTPPEGFEAAQMQQGNAYVPAYQAVKSKDSKAKDFYLLYAVNETGENGYYLYDALVGTCQRYVALGGGMIAGKASSASTIIIGMLAIVIVGLCVFILSLILRNRELVKALEEKSERRTKPQEKAARVVQPDQAKAEKSSAKETAKAEKKLVSADAETEKTAAPDDGKAEETPAEGKKAAQVKPAQEKPVQEMPAKQQEQPVLEDLQIEIKDVEPYVEPSREEQERQLAAQREKEEKQRAARKAALEREIQKDERSRARYEASEQKKAQHMIKQAQREAEAERRAMEKLMAAEQLREQKLAQRRQQAGAQESAGTAEVKKSVARKTVIEPAAKQETAKPAADKAVIKPTPKQQNAGDGKGSQVPIFTLDKRTVSLTRQSAPNELDEDFEFEFINIDQD